MTWPLASTLLGPTPASSLHPIQCKSRAGLQLRHIYGQFLPSNRHLQVSPTLRQMAQKSSTRRKRRSTDELIADYEKKIRDVKARAKEKELKSSPAMKKAVSLVKAMDRCLSEAAEEGNNHLRHAVADGRKALSKYLQTQGVTLPKANLPRGRKPS